MKRADDLGGAPSQPFVLRAAVMLADCGDKHEGKATGTREPKMVRREDLLEGGRKRLLRYLHV